MSARRIGWLLTVAWLLSNLLTWQLGIAVGKTRMYVGGSLPFLLFAALLLAARRIGMKQLVFSLIPLLALLVVAEVGLRVFFHWFAGREQRMLLATPGMRGTGDAQLYRPHHYALYELNSEFSGARGLHHDSLGFRDEREFSPDPQAIRIVFIGGSTTYTHDVLDNRRVFTHGLEEKLREHYRGALAGRRLEVINAGLGGATSAENLVRLAFFVSEVSPDLVVVQHGINDVLPRAAGTLRSDYGNYRKRWEAPSLFDPEYSMAYDVVAFAARLTMIGNLVLTRTGIVRPLHLASYVTRSEGLEYSEAAFLRNDARYFERNTRYMVALARAMGSRVMLVSEPFTERLTLGPVAAEHNRILARLARQEGALFFDLFEQMVKDDVHLPDGMHVSQRGSDLKRDLYFRHLLRVGIVERMIREHEEAFAAAAGGW
jgi:lysophospholipase L1-like esterase